ncbi:MAG: hypothetical protein AAGF85_08310 [Bacteroidota bacterium]
MKTENPSNHSDEIDLGDLLLRIVNILSRNKVLILIFIGVGGGLGFIHKTLKSPVYDSSMMLQSDILTEAYSETLTENLKKLIEQGNHILLADKLYIDEDQASQLVDIKVEGVEGASGPEGAVENFIFLISVETKDNAILEDLQRGIIKFLENNEFVKKRIDAKRSRYNALIDQMKAEGNEMDSLKGLVNKQLMTGESNNLVFLDPSNIYEQALRTYKEELSYQEQLTLIESIQLIEGFIAFERPIRPRLAISLASGVGLALLLAIGTIFLKETRKYLQTLESKSS